MSRIISVFYFQIHLEEGPGDILAFLTGQEEIEAVERLVHERIHQLPEGSQQLITVPIYSSLPSDQQMNAFKPAPYDFRKVNLIVGILIDFFLKKDDVPESVYFFITL